MKFENTEVLKDLLINKGTIYKGSSYIINVSDHGKTKYLGSYKTLKEAQNVLYNYRYNKLLESLKKYQLNIDDALIIDNNYLLFKNGLIFNLYGKKISGRIDRCGYKEVNINNKRVLLHRIIAKAYIENPNNYPCINHIDGNKLNNNISNLEWCTHSQNTIHAYNTGLEKKVLGEKHHNNKLTEEQVIYIKKNYKPRDPINGATALGKKFGVSRYAIQDVARQKSWGWLNAV